jgi:hypothetical protein
VTTSKHTYRAFLIADPDDVEMPVRGGTIRLDVASAPHVTASLTVSAPGVWEFVPVEYPDEGGLGLGYGEGAYGAGGYGGYITEATWTPDEIALAALDPRLDARVRIEVDSVTAFGTVSRVFDLGLRSRSIAHGAAEIALELASDEALLLDWAPLADDKAPLALESSLRDVIDYVLGEAIPGAALESSPSTDADVTRYWPITNIIPNPAPGVSSTDWQIGFNGVFVGSTVMGSPIPPMGPNAIQWTTGAGTSTLAAGEPSSFTVNAGEWYVWSVYLASGVATNARAALQWRSRDGVGTLTTDYGSVVSSDNLSFKRLHVIAQAPEGAESVWPFIDTAGNAASAAHFAAGAMLYQGEELVPYFDGDETDTAEYEYEWADDTKPHESASVRTPLVDGPDEHGLTWRAGVTALDFLAPLIQRGGMRLVCDELRQWTLRDEFYEADGSVSIRHALNMTAADETISRDSGIWFDAAVAQYTDPVTGKVTTDHFALNTPYTRLRVFEFDSAYPGPGFAEYAVNRAQERGRQIDARAVSDFSVVAEQSVTLYLDDTPAQVGKTEMVTFDLDNDEMTVSARTKDSPDGAIDLLLGTIDSLVGTIDSLEP